MGDEVRGKDRLVPLDVDDDVLGRQVEEPGGFGQAVAARGVVLPGHEDPAPEGLHALLDARIIGGHPDPVQILDLQGPLIDPLDQGFPQDQRQGLPRKAGGAEAGGDEGDGFHKFIETGNLGKRRPGGWRPLPTLPPPYYFEKLLIS